MHNDSQTGGRRRMWEEIARIYWFFFRQMIAAGTIEKRDQIADGLNISKDRIRNMLTDDPRTEWFLNDLQKLYAYGKSKDRKHAEELIQRIFNDPDIKIMERHYE